MGQFTSRITNNNPSNNTNLQSPPSNDSPSPSTSSLAQSNSQSSLDQLPNELPSISSPMNQSIRRRRSSTYNTSSLPNPRRRRLPRLNDTIRFWQRRNQVQQQQPQSTFRPTSEERDVDETSDDLISSFVNELESDSVQRSSARLNNRSGSDTTPNDDPLDISNFAGLASNILSSRRSSQQQHHHHHHTGHVNDASSTESNEPSTSNSMSFEHQTEMLSRLLEIAATSTVSNLMGSSQVNGRRFDNTSRLSAQRVLNDNFNTIEANGHDSNFQEFVRALRHGLLTNELNERYGNDGNLERLNDMTFFRAFRFDSEQTSQSSNHQQIDMNNTSSVNVNSNEQTDSSTMDMNENNDNNNDTSTVSNNDVNNPNVPVMIIGVRSVQNAQDSTDFSDDDVSSHRHRSSTFGSTTHNQSDTNQNVEGLESSNSGEVPASNFGSGSRSGTRSNTQSASATNTTSTATPTTQQRSWVIFVMGNTFAWNHPLLSAPSLMSENPTYEDLLNLQELIGQVKPQVTTKEELNENNDQLFEAVINSDMDDNKEVKPHDGVHTITDLKKWELSKGERCQICLEDFQHKEIIRNLKNCNHFYHQLCIDNWLLNGKNNCPLCRSKGIINAKAGDEGDEELGITGNSGSTGTATGTTTGTTTGSL